MGLKYRWKRLKVRLNRVKNKDLDLSDVQKEAYDLIMQMINDKSSILLYDPEKGRKGLKNKGAFIIIYKHKLRITNGSYPHDVPIDDRIHDYIVEKFNHKLTRIFNSIEAQSDLNVKDSINNIKNSIKENLPDPDDFTENKSENLPDPDDLMGNQPES